MRREYTLNAYVESKRTEGTSRIVRRSITNFLRACYPDDADEDAEVLSLRYLHSVRDPLRDLQHYVKVYERYAPKTLNNSVSSVVTWLDWNSIGLSGSERKILRSCMPRVAVITEDDTLTVELIRKLLSHSDVMLRAFILILASSGMRADELVNVRFTDMREGSSHRFYIPAVRMKARKPHVYRFSMEAWNELGEYLKVRDSYLKLAIEKTHHCLHRAVPDEGDYIFPVSYTTLRMKFIRALRDAGVSRRDERGRYSITFQSFRRFFDSTIKLHMSLNMANEIVGHDEGLSTNYRRYPADQVDAAYLEAEKYLVIQSPPDYAALKGGLSDELKEQRATSAILAEKMIKMEVEFETIKKYIELSK